MKTTRWKRSAVLMAAAVAALACPTAPPAGARASWDDRVVVREVVRDVMRDVHRDIRLDVRRHIRRDVSRGLREVRELRRLVHEDLRALRDLQLEYAEPVELRAALDRLQRRLRELEMRLEAEGWR